MGGYHRGGYVRPAEIRRKPITSTVSQAEHAQLSELARREGKPTTTYVTCVLRDHLARHQMMPVRAVESAEVA